MMSAMNPAGTDGFDFLEFTTTQPNELIAQFEALGFTSVARHKSREVVIYQQNDIRFILNVAANSAASRFALRHGASVSAMGFRVANASAAFEWALSQGAVPYTPSDEERVYNIPAIQGVGQSLIYFVDYPNDTPNYQEHFRSDLRTLHRHVGVGLDYIDHVTHNLYRGEMDRWADFYTKIFNFREIRYFDIEGKLTGLKSRAMTSPCGKIRIPLNESSDDHSQIEEFLKLFNGEGIQHIALGTEDIYQTVTALRHNQIQFLDTPDAYYELLDKRLPNHGESNDRLKELRILLDGSTKQQKPELLLQIFTENMLGPVFFEVIQRKGDEGFGEGNFKALFESIELDQIRRGVLKDEGTKI